MKKEFRLAIFYVVLLAGVILIAWFALRNTEEKEQTVYSDIIELFQNKAVKEFSVSGKNVVTIKCRANEDLGTKEDEIVTYKLRDFSVLYYDLTDENGDINLNKQVADGIVEKYEYTPIATTPWWVSLLPTVIIFVIFIAIWIWMMNQMAGGKGGRINNFGRSRAKLAGEDKNQKRIYFKDVAGADEEKAELAEIVDFLRDPEKYTRLGAKIPHGVLLMGPPGTGKTLMAKAVAGEAGVPFFSISGSDFVEMYVGVGASRVRDLFETARRNPASIIFIDEIDAVGRRRGTGLGGGHDEREQTLNQLLVEMDGFGTHDNTIVMAATNRADVLDPALLRPGRFDRQITVNYPDLNGREAILNVHAKGKPFEKSVDFRKIAQTTVGFTGADLANLLNEASLLAARRNKSLIGMDEIEESYMKVILGPKKKNKVRRAIDNKLTAYHEAGHAIAAYFSPHADPVRHITIIPAGSAGGVTVMVPEEDVSYQSRNELFDDIVVSLGGRIAEELTVKDISTGATSDISKATNVARNMVTRFGMSSLGPILYGSEHSADEVFLGRDFYSEKNYSEQTAAKIDEEISLIISKAAEKCRQILTEHMDKLTALAEYLIHAESCDGEILKAIIDGEPTFEELDALAEEKRRKSREENENARSDTGTEEPAENENHETDDQGFFNGL